VNRRYKVLVLDRKVGRWIQIDNNPYDPTELAHHYHMTMDEESMLEIDRWVLQHDLGRRQSFDMWQLHDDKSLTMFLLKWGE
jgi:hypothetical protein